MVDAGNTSGEPPVRYRTYAWLALPLAMKVAPPVTGMALILIYSARQILNDVEAFGSADPGASLVLISFASLLNDLGLGLNVFGGVMLIVSFPLMTRSQLLKRIESKLYVMPVHLERAAIHSAVLAEKIRRSDEELRLYSELEGLKEITAAALARAIVDGGSRGIRATWVATAVALVVSVVLAILLR